LSDHFHCVRSSVNPAKVLLSFSRFAAIIAVKYTLV